MSAEPRRVSALRAGDLIGVCAPSGPVERDRLTAGVATLERLGFRVRVPDGILERSGFTAGNAARRQAELLGLLRDDAVRAVICARGGAGAIELLPGLDGSVRELSDLKPVVGYSDITFLHLLLKRAGVVSFLGPMAARGLDAAFDENSLVHALTGEGEPYATPAGTLRLLRPGQAEGTLLGGCLSILASAAGTPWGLRLDTPTVLFLEDVNEPPYRLHRMLHQLRLSGAFENVVGVVFGEMPGCEDSTGATSLEHALLSALDGLEIPTAYGLPAGHTSQPAVTLPLGVPARVICDGATAHFTVLGRGVA
jgi:muramoyltetrapeptide carboxypeptidase